MLLQQADPGRHNLLRCTGLKSGGFNSAGNRALVLLFAG